MGWNEANVLHGGIFIDYKCQGITDLPEGVFIPFTPNNKPAMHELNDFLHKYGYIQEGGGVPEWCFHENFVDYFKRTGKIPVHTPDGIVEKTPN